MTQAVVSTSSSSTWRRLRVISIWVDGPAVGFDTLLATARPIVETLRFQKSRRALSISPRAGVSSIAAPYMTARRRQRESDMFRGLSGRSARPRLLLIALIAAGPVALGPGTALATQPGVNGLLTYMRFDDDNLRSSMSPIPMTHEVQLTSGVNDAWFPAWSPDSKRIAFSSGRTDPDPNDGIEIHDVFTMLADGSDVRQITDSPGFNGEAVVVTRRSMAPIRR